MEMVLFFDPPFNEYCDSGVEITDCVLVRPTTVMVTKSHFKPPGSTELGCLGPSNGIFPRLGVRFESAEHLVNVVSSVFGNCVERIILNIWAEYDDDLVKIYWPHTVHTKKAKKGAK